MIFTNLKEMQQKDTVHVGTPDVYVHVPLLIYIRFFDFKPQTIFSS